MRTAARWSSVALAPAVRFLVTPPHDVTLLSGGVISPDGRWLVYVGGDSSGQSMLMLRALDAVDEPDLDHHGRQQPVARAGLVRPRRETDEHRDIGDGAGPGALPG